MATFGRSARWPASENLAGGPRKPAASSHQPGQAKFLRPALRPPNAVPPKQQQEEGAPPEEEVAHLCEGLRQAAISAPCKPEEEQRCAFSASLLPPGVPDIDAQDGHEPQLCSQYAQDIFDYLAALEVRLPVHPHFLRLQPTVTSDMRSVLVNWLMQVHARFQLLQETLFLTVALVDRYLQCQVVSRSKLQLLGMGALYVASKYEETLVPAVSELAYVADGAYRAAEVLHMEGAILRALDWRLGRPLPLHFLRRNSKAAQVDVVQHAMAKYILELCLLHYPMAWVKPSEQAAAALCLAIHLCGQGHSWGATMAHYGRYSEEALQPTIKKMAAILAEAPRAKHRAPYDKYKSSRHENVSGKALASTALLRKIAQQGTLA